MDTSYVHRSWNAERIAFMRRYFQEMGEKSKLTTLTAFNIQIAPLLTHIFQFLTPLEWPSQKDEIQSSFWLSEQNHVFIEIAHIKKFFKLVSFSSMVSKESISILTFAIYTNDLVASFIRNCMLHLELRQDEVTCKMVLLRQIIQRTKENLALSSVLTVYRGRRRR